MTLEQKVLLNFLKSHISGEREGLKESCQEADIVTVINEAKAQSVLLMFMDTAAAVDGLLPITDFREVYDLTFMLTVNNAEVERAQKKLVELLEDSHKPYAIIKGEAASSYYPRPELRILGDVDFLIDPKNSEELTELLILNGYTKKEEEHICHIVFKKPKAHLEMHFEVVGIPNGKSGEAVRNYIKNAVYDTEKRNNGMGEFNVLGHAKNGLVLLLHMVHHMLSEGIGLRHLCDWAFFVNSTKNMPFWEVELLPILNKIGLLKYAQVMTKTASIYLGTYCPLFAEQVNEALCEEVIEDIFSGGNFGRKDRVYSQSGLMVSNHAKDGVKKSKLSYASEVVRASVKHHHPIAIKIKMLYPIFAFYRILRYLLLMLMGKKESLAKTVPTANRRRDLYSKLNVFEVEEE